MIYTEKYDGNQTNLNGYIRLPEVLKLIPISKSSWWKGVKAGKYPRPVKLSERTTAWKVVDIYDLISRLNEI